MRRSTIIILIILGLTAAGLLAWALIARRAPEPVQNVANNVPLVNKEPVVPPELSAQDETDIAEVARSFLFQFGTYSETTRFRNINGATYYAEAGLRSQMVAYADAQRAAGVTVPTGTIGSIDVAEVVVAFEPALSTTPSSVVARVTGTTKVETDGRGVVEKFSGELTFVKVGDFWFVSDMAFTPPLLGFK